MDRSYTFSDGSIVRIRLLPHTGQWAAEMYLKIDVSSYRELSAHGDNQRKAMRRLHTEYMLVTVPGLKKVRDKISPKKDINNLTWEEIFAAKSLLSLFLLLFLVGCASSPFSKQWVWKSTPGEYGGAEDSIRAANARLDEARKRDPEMFKKLDKAVSDDVITIEVYDPEREKNENGRKFKK